MIIEFVDIENTQPDKPSKLVLIHVDLDNDRVHHLRKMSAVLREKLDSSIYEIVFIPGGQPCPNNPLPKITVFNSVNEDLMKAIKTLCERSHGQPGEYIPLPETQFKALAEAQSNGDLIHV